MRTELFRAILAVQVSIRRLREPLWESEKGNLPPRQKRYGNHQKTPGISLVHKKQGSKHHGIIPIINTAGTAAFILQKP